MCASSIITQNRTEDDMCAAKTLGCCPQCGSLLTYDYSDIFDNEDHESASVSFYYCDNCGARIEFCGCANSEKQNYPYWNEG